MLIEERKYEKQMDKERKKRDRGRKKRKGKERLNAY